MSDNQQPPKTARDNRGRFLRTVHTVERDAAAAQLRSEGATFKQIADQLGYCDKGEAWRAVQRALTMIVKEPAERLRAVEAAKLDELYVEALEVLGREHLMVSHGRIVTSEDGQPLLDDGPKLAAVAQLLKVRESYRKLFGLDAANKTEVTGGVRYELVGVDPEALK